MINVKDLTDALQRIDPSRGNPRGNYNNPVYAGGWATETQVPTTSTVHMHGPRGLFGVMGLEQDVISTRVVPRGLAGALPVRESNILWPEFAYIMGYTDSEAVSDAQGICDDPPEAGAPTGCIQSAQFGRYSYETRPIELTHVGDQINRGEFMDLRLLNDPVGDPLLSNITPDSSELNYRDMLNNEALERMIGVGIAFQNKLVRQVYTGNPANNNTGGGYREFPGLDIQIGTGKRDAHTQFACPNLDSLLVNYNRVKTSTDTSAIVTRFFDVYYHLKIRAMQQRLNPATWAITMRMSLFNELAYIWPCAMAAMRCSFVNGDNDVVENISVDGQLKMQQEIRNNFYLPIHGDNVPVIIDDGIQEEDTNDAGIDDGCFASHAYFVPMTYLGNRAATYWEFYDYRKAMQAAQAMHFQDHFWTDNGRFWWERKTPKLSCVQLAAVVEPRILLRVPQLAAKISNIQYCPFLHERSALPGDIGYYDTGVGVRAAPTSLYTEWGVTS